MPPTRPVLVPLLLALGCASKTPDSAAPAGDSAAGSSCGGAVDDVQPGLSVDCASGACALVVVATDPAPPDRGDNRWQLEVRDPDGAPAALSSLTVAPFMPAHDHGTAPAEFAGTATDTVWSVGPFDLFMPGRWELRTALAFADGSEDSAVVAFCVEG